MSSVATQTLESVGLETARHERTLSNQNGNLELDGHIPPDTAHDYSALFPYTRSAVKFESASSHALTRTHEPWMFGGNWTLFSFWFLATQDGGNEYLITHATTANNLDWAFYRAATNAFRFYWWPTGDNPSSNIATAVNTAEIADGWQHFVVTWDAATTTLRLYRNGVEEASNSSVTWPQLGTPDLAIGRGLTATFGDGTIQQPAVVNGSNAASDVTWLYNSGTGRSPEEILSRFSGNVSALYPLDEHANWPHMDLSGNGRHLTKSTLIPSSVDGAIQQRAMGLAAKSVYSFRDQSGADHPINATVAQRPLWLPNGAVPYVRTDGIDDRLRVTYGAALGLPRSRICVAGLADNVISGTRNMTDGVISTARASLFITSGTFRFSGGTGLDSGVATDRARHVHQGVIVSGASDVVRVDGTEVTGDAGDHATLTGLNIGSRYDPPTQITRSRYHAILDYNRALTASERAAIQAAYQPPAAEQAIQAACTHYYRLGTPFGDGPAQLTLNSENNVQIDASGNRLKSLFNGSNYYWYPDHDTLSFAGKDMVFACVAKLPDFTTAQRLFGKWTGAGDQREYTLQVETSGVANWYTSRLGSAATQVSVAAPRTVTAGVDWFFAARRDHGAGLQYCVACPLSDANLSAWSAGVAQTDMHAGTSDFGIGFAGGTGNVVRSGATIRDVYLGNNASIDFERLFQIYKSNRGVF